MQKFFELVEMTSCTCVLSLGLYESSKSLYVLSSENLIPALEYGFGELLAEHAHMVDNGKKIAVMKMASSGILLPFQALLLYEARLMATGIIIVWNAMMKIAWYAENCCNPKYLLVLMAITSLQIRAKLFKQTELRNKIKGVLIFQLVLDTDFIE